MPLIDLKTDLKSLKFGKDRPGGGSSNQPYIQKDIPEGDPSNIFNTGGPDFLLRGGVMAPIRAANDTSRLAQMLFDLKSPNGLLFTATENLLSRTAVKTEASKGVGYGGGAVNAGIYTPLSTLGQAATGLSGTHLNLLGLDPTSPMAGVADGGLFPGIGLNRYEDIVRANNSEDNNSFPQETETTIQIPNPLYLPPILGAQPPLQEPEFIEEISFKTTGGFKNRLANIWYNKQLGTDNSPNILEYDGGPGSILGIGKTNIKFADQRTGDRNPLSVSKPSFFYGTGNKDKYSLSPQSKDISSKLKGVTNFASHLLPSEENKEEISNIENPNRILEKYYVLDRNNSESSNALKWNNRTIGDFIDPTTKGASEKFTEYGGEGLTNTISSDGGNTWDNTSAQTTTKPNSLEINPNLPNPIVKSTQTLDGTQEGGIRINYSNAISADGVSNLYNNLVKPISGPQLDNTYTDKNFFNVYDPNTTPGNTWPLNTILQVANGSLTFNQREIIETTPISKGGIQQDFRKTLLDNTGATTSTIMSLSPSYNPGDGKTIEGRVNIGNPGTKKDVYRYSTSTAILDKINASGIYTAESPNHAGDKNDLVKFSIGKVLYADSTKSNYMNFRAFIDSFEDQYNAEWGDIQYVGRGDKFYNYKGFNRTINMSWTVYAQSKGELIPMYKKLNYLAGSLAGDYNYGFLRGSLHRLTVGGYLYNQLGIIKGLTYSVPTESPWEIGINEEGGSDTTVKELPFMIKVTGFQFIPIHDFVPRTPRFEKETRAQLQRYIALSNGGNNNYDS